ncbi:Ig-like domain repeat protein [Candidatus Collierbacteria bacterium]|nr:Ig-like domain repeat protein [Candidatus Collierbacteria bacterium]
MNIPKRFRRFISFFLSFTLLFQTFTPAVLAVDELITPQPTVTEEQVAPSPEPTPDLTLEPTVEPTPEITPEPTIEITPGPTETPTPAITVEPTPAPTPRPLWVEIDGDTITTSENVGESVDYRFEDTNLVVRFTKVTKPGKLTIKQVTLTPEQVVQSGALSNLAYDITSDMENGTFIYDLTLPLPENEPNAKVEFAHDQNSLSQSQTIDTNITQRSDVIEIKGLTHFTLFFVTSGTDQATNGDFCTSLSLPCTFNASTLTALQSADSSYLDIADYTASGSVGWPNLDFGLDRYVQFDFSPSFDSGSTISNAKLKLVYKTSSIDSLSPYGAKVEITDDNLTWTEIASTTAEIGPDLSTADQTYQITLPAAFQNPTSLNNLKVRFFLYGDDQTLPGVLTSFNQVILDTSTSSTFIYTSTYIRANSTADIGGQVRVPDYATEVNYLFSNPSYTVTLPGYKHIQAGFSPWAGYAHWRVKPSLPNGEYQVTADYLVGATTGVVTGSAVLYSLDKPWAKWVYPNDSYRNFRPSDNPLRIQVDDEFNQFSYVIFNIDGQNFRVNRDQCDLREAGLKLNCDINDSSTWSPLVEGTYDTYSTGNTTARVKATVYTKANNRFDPADFIESNSALSTRSFYIDGTPPVLSDLTVDNLSSFYTNLVTASANPTDNFGIKNVLFYVTLPRVSDGICDGNGAKILQQSSVATDIDGRYRTSIDTSTLNGEYCLNAVAEDNAMGHSNIEKIKMVFDNTSPSVPGVPTTTTPTSSLTQVWNWTAATDSGGDDASGVKGYWFNTSVTPAWSYLGNLLSTSTDFSSDGLFQFSVKAEDNAGNLGNESTGEVTLDVSPPVLSEQTTYSGWYNSDQVSTFTYSDNNGIVSGLPVTCTISTEGENQICSVTPNVCDAAGNCNTSLVVSNGANIDKTLPFLTFSDDVSSGPVTSENVIFVATDTYLDTSSTKYGFSDDAICDATDSYLNSFISGETFSISDETTNGKYICAKAADLAGNTSYQLSSNPLNIDVTNPVGNITNPANNSYQKTRPTYRVTASDSSGVASVKFQYRLSGSPDFIDLNTDLTSTYQANWGSVVLVTNSVYELRAIVTDNPGNFAFTPIISFTFDNRLPEILYNNPLGGQTVWYNYSPTFDIDFLYDAGGSPLDYAQYRLDGGTYKNIFTTDRTTDYTTNWSIASWSTLTEGSHQLDIRLRDKASNINTDNYLSDISGLMVGKDLTAPGGSVSLGTATISDGDLIQEVTIDYSESMDAAFAPTITFGSGTWTPEAGTWTTNTRWTQNFTLTDLNEVYSGVITTSFSAKDLAGNSEVTDTATFDIDTKNPTLSDLTFVSNNANPIYAKEGDSVTLHFFSSEPIQPPTVLIAGHVVTATNNLPLNGNEWTAAHSMIAADTEGNIAFSINYLDAVNNAGNEITNITSGQNVFYDNTDPTDPTTITSAPHIASIWSNDNTVDVSWSGASDEGGSGVDGFYTEWNNSLDSVNGPLAREYDALGNSETSPSLSDGNSHYFHIATIDKAGNWTGTTHAGPFYIDSSAPTDPGTPTPSPTSPTNQTSITWSWSSTDAAVSGLKQYIWNLWQSVSTWIMGGTTVNTTETIDISSGNGNYTFDVQAEDNAGNISGTALSVNLQIDTASPSSSVTSPTYDNSGAILVDFIVADELGGSGVAQTVLWYRVDTGGGFGAWVDSGLAPLSGISGTFNFDPAGTDGTYEFHSIATDNAGNVENASVTADDATIYDDTNPDSTITDPSNSGTDSTIYTNEWSGLIKGTAIDTLSGVNSIKVSIKNTAGNYFDGETFAESGSEILLNATYAGGNWEYAGLTSPVEGSYTIKSHAIDAAGNIENSYKLTVVLDKTIPEVSISLDPTTPDSGNNWYKTDPTITLAAADNTVTDYIEHQWNSNSGIWTAYGLPFKTPGEGSHTLYYRAFDKAGNVSDIGIKNIKYDKTELTVEPKNVSVNPNPTSGTTAKVKWDAASDNIGIEKYEVNWSLDGTATSYTDTVGNDIREHDINKLDQEGKWNITVTAFDAAGNKKSGSTELTVDRGAPASPVLRLDGTGTGEATLGWNLVSDAIDYIIWYGNVSGTYLYGARVGNINSFTVRGLGGGDYYFVVKSVDSAGNQSGYSNEVNTIALTGTPGVGPGIPAEGFSPEVKGASTEVTPTETLTPTPEVLGESESKNNLTPWLILIFISSGGLVSWAFFRRR